MNVESIQAGDQKLHFKFTKRAIMAFEAESGYNLGKLPDDLTTTQSLMLNTQLVKHAIHAGSKLVGNPKTYTNDEILDLDEQYDIIEAILQIKESEEEKK